MREKQSEPLYKMGEVVIIEDTETRAKVLEVQSTGGSWLYTLAKEPFVILGYTIIRSGTTICMERELSKSGSDWI